MDWNRTCDRLCLLSMMSLGCTASDDVEPDPATGTGSTSAAATDDTTGSTPPADSTGNGTGMATGTDDGMSTGMPTSGSSGGSTAGDSTTAADGSTGDSSSGDTTAGIMATPFVEACVESYVIFGDCYGYAEDPDVLQGYCEETESLIDMYYDKLCKTAQIDYFACLSPLECATLTDFVMAVAACNDEYTAGMKACPEFFPLCQGGGGGSGPGECMLESSECLNGNTYEVTCTNGNCVCTINGGEVGTFMAAGKDPCFEDDFGDTVADECGFPPGIFF